MSIATQAFDRLALIVAAATAAPVERRAPGSVEMERVDNAGLIAAIGPATITVEGETLDGVKDCTARARFEIAAAQAARADLREAIDVAFARAVTAIEADRDLGGLVAWVDVEAPEELGTDALIGPGHLGYAANIAVIYTTRSYAQTT